MAAMPKIAEGDDAMAETMSPSKITASQVGKIQKLLGAALRKSGLQSEATRQVLETQGGSLVAELVAVIRKRVEAISKLITRHIRVDRTLTHQQALDATERKQYVNQEVLSLAPKGSGEGVDLCFFDLDYDPTVDELDREMEARGLKPDIDALAAFNAANPAFADDRPNATQWRDAGGNACYAIFNRWIDERNVNVTRFDHRWIRDFRFVGARK